MRLFNKISATSHAPFTGGPFTAAIQVRFKKSAKTAQTRLETRTLDRKLDRLAFHYRLSLVSEWKRGPFVSLNLLSRWAPHAGIKTLIAGNFRTSSRGSSRFQGEAQELAEALLREALREHRARSCPSSHVRGSREVREEFSAVGIIHELLSLTVEKMTDIERVAHFRKELGMLVNMCELLLKHPGVFCVAARGKIQIVFLREAYKGDRLIEASAVSDVRRRMLELLLLGCRNTYTNTKVTREEEEERRR